LPEQAQEFAIHQTIHASASRVYTAFTTAEGWRSWCCEQAECDPYPGGKLHIYTEGYHAYGVFRELEVDRTAVFSWDGDSEPSMLIQIKLDEQTDRTQLTFLVRGLCSKPAWDGIATTIEGIWRRVLKHLKDVLEG
jgi:uncharacterized protein YndB with AHSA1/START domain